MTETLGWRLCRVDQREDAAAGVGLAARPTGYRAELAGCGSSSHVQDGPVRGARRVSRDNMRGQGPSRRRFESTKREAVAHPGGAAARAHAGKDLPGWGAATAYRCRGLNSTAWKGRFGMTAIEA